MNLNDKTTIPLWSVLASLPVVVGFIMWLSTVASSTEANARDIRQLREEKETDRKILITIKEDVAFIRGTMSQKNK